jgi:hypothetical protein
MDLMNRSGKLLPIFEWPTRLTSYSPRETELALSQLDDKVLSLSIKLAEKFIAENAHGKADHVAEQVATVRILLQHARYGKRNEFLETSKIIGQFASHPHLQVSLKAFGRMIIGPLRDDGVLVTSGPRGYRLVSSVSDLRQFVEYYHSFLAPMLKRISYYRSIVMLGTKNSLDILAGRKFAYLRDYYKTQSHSLRRRT